MTNDNLRAELERANRLDYAAERLRGKRLEAGRAMSHETVQAAAAELAKIDGAPVHLEELDAVNVAGLGPRYRAEIGHRIYRPSTLQQYEDLTGMLFAAGYPEAPYPEYSTYGMTNPDGTRSRCSIVIVKPEEVAR